MTEFHIEFEHGEEITVGCTNSAKVWFSWDESYRGDSTNHYTDNITLSALFEMMKKKESWDQAAFTRKLTEKDITIAKLNDTIKEISKQRATIQQERDTLKATIHIMRDV